MKLDTLGRTHADEARLTVTDAQIPTIDALVHRTTSGWLLSLSLGALATLAALVIILVVRPATDGTLTFGAASPGITGTTVPSAGPENFAPSTTRTTAPFATPLQWVSQATLASSPTFDTTSLGEEQPLNPVETLTLFAQRRLSEDLDLLIDEAAAIGYLPGTRHLVLTASGTINNPGLAGYGEPGRCYWVSLTNTDGLGDCHWILTDTTVRPIGVGLVGRDWVGWSFLPPEASVTVLNVNGVDRFWQQPRNDITIFSFAPTDGITVEVRILDADGVEIGRADLTRPAEPTEPTVEPIIGYGDFSDVPYADIDWFEVTALQVQCVNDQGFPVTILRPGDGIRFGDVPDDQNRDAQFAMAACRAGLKIPEPPE